MESASARPGTPPGSASVTGRAFRQSSSGSGVGLASAESSFPDPPEEPEPDEPEEPDPEEADPEEPEPEEPEERDEPDREESEEPEPEEPE